MSTYNILSQTERQRVSDGEVVSILSGCESSSRKLVLILPQLGDFDSLEYAWWLQREAQQLQAQGIAIRAVGIGNRTSGQKFCNYTGFPADCLFVDPTAQLHQTLNLYSGLSLKLPGLSPSANAWLNLILMCAGIGSPGTLAEVFRGSGGDNEAESLLNQGFRLVTLPKKFQLIDRLIANE